MIVLINFLANLATGWPLISFVVTLAAGLVIALISLLSPLAAGWAIALISLFATLAAGWLIAWMGAPSSVGLSQIWAAGLAAPYTSLRTMLWGLMIAVFLISLWELSAYRSAVAKATNIFPLDRRLLRNNAITATLYMGLGALFGFAFHLRAMPVWIPGWIPSWLMISPWLVSWLISFGVVIVAILLAVPWLRQKITWQKAALPYLCRLGDAAPTIEKKDAEELQNVIDQGAPPAMLPCPLLICGPIGSGRTAMAAAIGTEFAFKNYKVRYISLDMLQEFAASASGHLPDDPGPKTISYWPWHEAQIVIIDNVGPLLAAQETRHEANLKRFKEVLDNDLKSIAGVLVRCHTIWVIGDLRPSGTLAASGRTLEAFAEAVRSYCCCENVLIIELGDGASLIARRKVRWLYPKV